MTYDKNRPVSSIKYDDKRAAIPDSAHQGEEQMAISGMPEQSEYDIFRHEFQRGRDPELYWLNKYKNDDEDNPDYMPQLRTDIRSLYKHEDIRLRARVPSYSSTCLAILRKSKKMNWNDWLVTTSIVTTGRTD